MLNKAIIIGRLTADPELRYTPNNIPVTSFSVAINRRSAKGEATDFLDIVAWRNTAEFITKYFNKGSEIAIVGSIQTRNYEDKQGNKRKAVEILADEVSFVGSKRDGKHEDSPFVPGGSGSKATDFEEIEDDGDLPF